MREKQWSHGTMYEGDCLELMHDIPDGSIDMILADLPYETTDCHWDSLISLDDYFEQATRVLKINGVAALFCQPPFTYLLGMTKPKLFRHNWVWIKDKSCDVLAAPYKPQKRTEDILIFSQCGFAHNANNKCTYNPQKIKSEGYTRKKITRIIGKSMRAVRNRPESSWKAMKTQVNTEYDGRFPVNYLYFPVPYGKCRIHPTQKPVALFEYLIRTYTNEGETILDNVIGSGTTAVAAFKAGRQWIGIEKDPEIFGKACVRIEEDTRQQNLFKQSAGQHNNSLHTTKPAADSCC